MKGSAIDHVNIRIPENDIEEALEFYGRVLGFEPFMLEEFRNGERTSFFFKIGEDALINIRPVEEFETPSDANFDHFCILLDEDIEDVKDKLMENDVEIFRTGEPLGADGRGPAVYIRDPFGYKIELKTKK